MCGIAGCTGNKRGISKVIKILTKLEYRGYDSSGIAYLDNNELNVVKSLGNLQNFKKKVSESLASSTVIGHTRWATHGKPSIINAHPHLNMDGTIALVHNGIIENYKTIKSELTRQGIKFVSQTDTEVIAQLLGQYLRKNADCNTPTSAKMILGIISKVLSRIKGSYAFAFLYRELDNYIFFAKNGSPLIVGQKDGETYLASDENALKENCDQVYRLRDQELGYIHCGEIYICNTNLTKKAIKLAKIDKNLDDFSLSGYSSYLNKEIEEGINSALKTIKKCQKEMPKLLPAAVFDSNFNLHITACGTALHAGRIAKYLIEKELRIPVDLDFASEFKYKKPLLDNKSLCLFFSQSGETADTLGCVELAKKCGATTIGITNVKNSRLDEAVDFCLYTYAGAEISVASTKAYMAQLALVYAFVIYLAQILNKKISFTYQDVIRILVRLKNKCYLDNLKPYLELISSQKSLYFVGRGLDYFVVMEGALKLKEICYIHCEAFAGGELKHGPLALISPDSVVVAVLTQRNLIDKMLNNIHEMNSRGAKVILFSPFTKMRSEVYGFVKLPACNDVISPFGAIKPLQELTLYVAEHKGIDPDKPRNLAKSVTVE